MWIADDFRPALAPFHLGVFESSCNRVYGLRSDLSLGYHNTASCLDEAEDCHGQLRGCPEHADCVSLFRRVLRRGEALQQICTCPERGPHLVKARPLQVGLLVSLHRVGQPAPAGSDYTSPLGVITQCATCKLTRRADLPTTWDWVPAFVEAQPDNLSHGLCPICFQVHYPELARRYYARDADQGPQRRH